MPHVHNSLYACWFFLSLIFLGCVPIAQTGSSNTANSSVQITQDGIYENRVFHNYIKTVQLLRPEDPFQDAVVSIEQEKPLWLQFDILEGNASSNYDELFVKIIHCNSDWRKSLLNNLDYLEEFNEFRVSNYEFSIDTKVAYTQYRFQVPRVKMPGNYVAVVYRNRNENDVLFTHRFMVYHNRVAISANILRSSGVKERNTHHQIEFTVNYKNYDIPNPYDGVIVVLRQNQCWYNGIEGLKPTFVRQSERELEYRHFSLENNFPAGSEYRFFDLRLTRALGQNVGNVNREKSPIEAFLLKDQSRLTKPYSQYTDLNGGFAIGTTDTGGNRSNLEADYVNTHFFLESETPVNGNVYITGAFNNRILTNDNQLKYDTELKGYLGSLLLKQGFYNYEYYVESDGSAPTYFFEGSHYETENQYEIFIYHRPLGARADLLIGYANLSSSRLN